MTDNAPAFVPLLTKEQADAHLSPIACTNRDVMRRTALRVLTMTPEELTAHHDNCGWRQRAHRGRLRRRRGMDR